MKRDMDLIRDLLLKIENGRTSFQALPKSHAEALGISEEEALDDTEAEELARHLELLEEAGFAKFERTLDGEWFDANITWSGYEFLDNVRDPEIWEMAKRGASKAGGAGLELLGQLAKGLLKTQIEKHTGVDIG
ncbi:DUF2513 domain-containing protein [Roseobacter sp. HKCCA0434]|uniref:DUF2513 domain-containing protein n=1 Tax=Roseobacter sp. HKCCA0434 TaxID=3079297 RepID=UPI002905D4CF|nr:DUF2513 domain-containing protein [Roseobacter sp. HKCCA0434]